MVYRGGSGFGGGRGGRSGGRSGSGPGRSRGGGGRSGDGYRTEMSSICRRAIEDKCDFGEKCRFSHLVKKLGLARGHDKAVKDIVMWEAQSQLLTSSADSTIKLWDCVSWKDITTIPVSVTGKTLDNSEGVAAMKLEGSWLFVGFEGDVPVNPGLPVGLVRAWKLDEAQLPPYEFLVSEHMPFGHTKAVLAIETLVDPTGNAVIFSGSMDGTIRYWQLDVASNSFKCGGVLEGHARGVTRLKQVKAGGASLLISASMDTTIKLWDLSTLKCIKTWGRLEEGHTDAVMDLVVWENQNEQFLISGGLDNNLIVWSLAPPFAQVYKLSMDSRVTCLCEAKDTNQLPVLMVGTVDGSIVIMELPSFDQMTVLSTNANFGHRDTVRRIITGPHGTFFSCGNDRSTIAWQWTGSIAAIKQQQQQQSS